MRKTYMLRYRYDGGAWKPYHVYPSHPTKAQIRGCRRYMGARKPNKRIEVDVRVRRGMHV